MIGVKEALKNTALLASMRAREGLIVPILQDGCLPEMGDPHGVNPKAPTGRDMPAQGEALGTGDAKKI